MTYRSRAWLRELKGVGPQFERRVQARGLRRSCRARGALALTYDDGPGRRLTPRVLDLLAEHRAHATFFALGNRAVDTPDVLDRVVAEGHEVGCHGFAHVNALAPDEVDAVRDIDAGYAALAPWMGEHGLFRPPYGKCSPATWLALRRRRARLGWWTADSGDGLLEPPDLDALVWSLARAGGGVVLLHDFDRGAAQRDREEWVMTATSTLLNEAARRDWRVVRQSDLII